MSERTRNGNMSLRLKILQTNTMRTVAILFTALPLVAQWLTHPEARTPRTKDGKPNLSARTPRMNGEPSLSGVWEAERAPESAVAEIGKLQIDVNDIGKYGANLFWDARPEDVPLRAEAIEIMNARRNAEPPTTHCLPAGVPLGQFNDAFKVIQSPSEIVIIDEVGDPPRQIFTDGRSLPVSPQPSWMGYSIGKWQGDTLTVDTIGFNDLAWLDGVGHPRSEGMHIRERYRRRDFGHMDWELTFEDPRYYALPFTVKTTLRLLPDTDVSEYVCNENEKDRDHLDKP
jgi:hypothetical protein